MLVYCVADGKKHFNPAIIDTRPTFARLLQPAPDRLEFVREIRPYLYVGTNTLGVRSAFCNMCATESSSMCLSCQALQGFQALWKRAKRKRSEVDYMTHQLISHQPTKFSPHTPSNVLTTVQLYQRTVLNASAMRQMAKQVNRFKVISRKVQDMCQVWKHRYESSQDDVPSFIKLFQEAYTSGKHQLCCAALSHLSVD